MAVIGIAIDRALSGVATRPAGNGLTDETSIEVVRIVDVDILRVLGEIPDIGRLEEVVIIGLGLLITKIETSIERHERLVEDKLRAVLSEPRRIDDFRVVVAAQGV